MINRDRLRLEIQRARMPFLLLIVLAVAAGASGWLILRNLTFERPWTDYYTVNASFSDVKGVIPGKQQVRIAGVQVGVVRDWHLRDGHPVVTLAIERRFGRLYRDARVRLRPVTPLQDMYIALQRGTAKAGILADGATLSAQRTRNPVDVSRIMNTFEPDVRQRLTRLLAGLGKGLDDNGARLRASFAELVPFLDATRRFTALLAERRANLARLVHNTGLVGEALGSRDRELRTLITQGDQALGELAVNDRPFGGTLAALPPALSAIRGSFASLRAAEGDLDPALRELRPAADALAPGLQALRSFSADAAPALVALRDSVRRLRPLATELSPTSAALDEAFARLEPSAPRLDRATAQVLPCRDDIEHFFAWTMSILKWGDVNGANPRADLTVGADSTAALGPDYNQYRTANCTDAPKDKP